MTQLIPSLTEQDLRDCRSSAHIRWEPGNDKPFLDANRAAQLADALRANPRLQSFRLSTDITTDAVPVLAAALRDCPKLEAFHLQRQSLPQESLRELADAAFASPALTTFQMREVGLDSMTATHICKRAARHDALHSICLSKNDLSGNTSDISAMLGSKQNWQRIRFMECALDEPAITHIAQSLGEQPHLCRFHLHQNIADGPDYPAIGQALLATGSVNLLSAFPTSVEAIRMADKNKADSIQAREDVQAARHAEYALPVKEIAFMAKRLPSIGLIARNGDERYICEDYLAEIPEWDGTTKGLCESGNHLGQCAAEHPSTWQNPERVFASAEAPLAEWLQRKTASGEETLLQCGLAHNPKGTISSLNARDIRLQRAELLDSKGQPSTLLTDLVETGEHIALFTFENWKDAKPSDLRAVLGALTAEQREAIPGRHQLVAQLGTEQAKSAGR